MTKEGRKFLTVTIEELSVLDLLKKKTESLLDYKEYFLFFFMREKHWIVHDTLIYWRNTFENY